MIFNIHRDPIKRVLAQPNTLLPISYFCIQPFGPAPGSSGQMETRLQNAAFETAQTQNNAALGAPYSIFQLT